MIPGVCRPSLVEVFHRQQGGKMAWNNLRGMRILGSKTHIPNCHVESVLQSNEEAPRSEWPTKHEY